MSQNSFHRYAGKVAFITGAARGQGRATAIRLAEEGADIIAVDLCAPLDTVQYVGSTAADMAETVRAVEDMGRQIIAVQADVRDWNALSSALQAGVEQLGRLDVVVANAGICSASRSWEITPQQWQQTIDTNLTGVFHTAKAAIPILIEQGTGGAMVFTSSVAGLRGLPFLAHYAASKHGVVGLCKTIANEVAQYNIRVNTVHPHGVATGMTTPELFALVEEHSSTLGPIFMGALPDQVSQPADMGRPRRGTRLVGYRPRRCFLEVPGSRLGGTPRHRTGTHGGKPRRIR
ncbi:mycofactocin-coupled SDR family oxidoreductase [Rhodococcus sp. IEGM 1366]|uniref:mycofactocin-coupled SDR family oxidoreductase n=1 Tax=Rhodococcus sp. IEGM 1366 TaxID=3082223 RepID=UPI002955CBE2|nr:mycofactocin-coupled SDR family oxidoreductase [Rhodococcus sp. IEGM 1366]MDV8071357.1 mycofactocin-coupled SDR family oxidoreductase [Rhodococcus sp. IEGM 1366]